MKSIVKSFGLSALAICMLTACDHDISIHNDVHEDGSLERHVTLYESDSAAMNKNLFGITSEKGWTVNVNPIKSSESDKDAKFNLTFSKQFNSVEEANSEMDLPIDSLFRISSTFSKENRWFYTYMSYSDTYRALNRFTYAPVDDYFTREDFAFIDRLPAEGKSISKGDSLYLVLLEEKIFDAYAPRTIFDEIFDDLMRNVREQGGIPGLEDTLMKKKDLIYRSLTSDDGGDQLPDVLGQLNISLPENIRQAVDRKAKEVDQRAQFVSSAYSGKYSHGISMPWTVIESNADSIAGNKLFWNPPVIKFLLTDYTMHVTARKLNIVPVIVSALVILGTIFLAFYRRPQP